MINIQLENPKLKHGKLKYKHLLGRKFEMGKHDCYSILRDILKDNLNIELTNYARPNDWWLLDEFNFYVDKYTPEGFILLEDPQLDDLRPLDVMLISIPDPRNMKKMVTNHCAVYLGEGHVIHHRLGQFSTIEPYRGALKQLTTHVIRHKDAPDLRNLQVNSINMMDLILPHKRSILMGALDESSSI